RGPGRVWLQTMPTMNLAKAVAPYISPLSGGGSGSTAGNIIGNLLDS
ncbi:MAG: TIGR00266 family protein, partial [Chloroflexota bacterium]